MTQTEELRKQQIAILNRDGYLCAANLLEQQNLDAEFKFLLDFVREGQFWGEPCCFQLRSLWTAYCLHAGLDVDTAEYDRRLRQLWEAFTAESWKTYDDFDIFMCNYLV